MDDEKIWAFLAVFIVFIIILSLVLYIVESIFLSKVFKKAGVPGYIAWIPVWNYWQIFELGGQKGYLSLLSFASIFISSIAQQFGEGAYLGVSFIAGVASIAGLVFYIMAMINIGRNFGKPDFFVLVGVFFNPIWLGILAFDKSTWQGVNHSQAQTASVAFSQNLQSQYANNPNMHQPAQQAPAYMPPTNMNQMPQTPQQPVAVPPQQNPAPNPENQPPQPPAPIQ